MQFDCTKIFYKSFPDQFLNSKVILQFHSDPKYYEKIYFNPKVNNYLDIPHDFFIVISDMHKQFLETKFDENFTYIANAAKNSLKSNFKKEII